MSSTRLVVCCTLVLGLLACQKPAGTEGTGGGSGTGGGAEQVPAALKVEAALSGVHATVGQQLTLTLTVTNTGGSPALGVSTSPLAQGGTGRVRIVSTAAEGTVDLEPGAQHAFTLTLEAADPGAVSLSGTAEAIDGPSGVALSADFGPLDLMLESPAYLSIIATHAPLAANIGQDVEVTITVSNDGEAEAGMVAVQLDSAPGSVPFERRGGSVPVVAQLKAGDTQAFTFTVRPSVAGNLALKAHAFGVDANDMSALVSDEVVLGPIGVERPAKLTAELELPDVVTGGQLVTATPTVRNDGDALARAVAPVPAVPSAVTVSGTATATATQGPAALDVPGGATVMFTWSYVASGSGVFSLAAHVRGTDQNDGAMVEVTSPATTAQVQPASALQIVELSAPTVLNPTQQFELTLKVKNSGGTTANGVLPDPMPPALIAGAGALARLVTGATAQSIAPGATATFVFHYAENGTGPGTLKFAAGARGTDSVSGLPLAAVATQSNVVSVLPVPALAIEAVTAPLKLSRSQAFTVEVRVKNTGGTAATNVVPALSFAATGDALASSTAVPAQTIAGGGRGIFTFSCTETGIGQGTLRGRATAEGTNPSFGTGLSAPLTYAPLPATIVQAPAMLGVVTFMLPAALTRGATFALGMVISNGGQADARLVAPTMPVLTVTGGAAATLVTGPTTLTIPGGKSRTFTWQYRENGTANGTLAFRAGATGADANSGAPLSAVAVLSNAAAIDAYMGCNGSQLYPGLDGHLLDRDRLDLVAGNDRLRVKPYYALAADFTRALGSQPASIRNQYATFDAYQPAAYQTPALPQPRWIEEQELSAISLYRAYVAAYQACVTLTATAPQYATAPTLSTATAECRAWQHRFWSLSPGTTETAACANFAVSPDNDGATPQLKWAATCATAAASVGFLAE